MKKSLKSLLVVLAMATAFVCAMAVASFSAEECKHEIASAGATLVHYDGEDPTCTENGYRDYYICRVCGEYWNTDRAGQGCYIIRGSAQSGSTDGSQQAFEEWKADLTRGGLGEATGHDEELDDVDGKPADCGNPGYREALLCKSCGTYFYKDADGQNVEIGDEDAYKEWCAKGGEGYLAPIGNHRWDKGVVQKDGSTLYTCEVCKATKVEPAKGVATGDAENMALWMMLAIAAMVAAGYVASRKEN